MTVSTTITKERYPTNGVTVDFPFTFYLTDESQVFAQTIDSDGNEVQYYDFTVSINANGNGGTLTTLGVLDDVDLLIYRSTPITQETDYPRGSRFPAASHEAALDKLTQIVQEQQEELDRTVKSSIGDDDPIDADGIIELIDTGDEETLVEAKSYTDIKSIDKSEIEGLIDQGDGETLISANQYTDQKTLDISYTVGWNQIGVFAPGVVIENDNDVLSYDGGLFRTTEEIPYITDGSSPDDDSGNWVTVSDGVLSGIARAFNVTESQVIYSTDTVTVLDNVIYIHNALLQSTYRKPDEVGAGERIVSTDGPELVTDAPETYVMNSATARNNFIYASEIFVLPSTTDSGTISLVNWLASGTENKIIFDEGTYTFTEGLVFDRKIDIEAQGVDTWNGNVIFRITGGTAYTRNDSGTEFVFRGAIPKANTIPYATSMRHQGGWRLNGSSVHGSNDEYYKIATFRDESSGGNAEGAMIPFSAGIRITQNGRDSSIKNLRIRNYWDGIDGFNQPLSISLGDELDVGLWLDGCSGVRETNVQVVGTFRKAAKLVTPFTGDATNTAYAIDNIASDCVYQGFASLLLRGCDVYRAQETGADRVKLVFNEENPWSITGGSFSHSETTRTYDTTTRDSDYIWLENVSDMTGITTGSRVSVEGYRAFGTAKNIYRDCSFYSMSHPSSLSMANPLFGTYNNSRCIEWAGERITTTEFNSCLITGRDEIAFFGLSDYQVRFNGGFMQGLSGNATSAGDRPTENGMRIISTPQYTLPEALEAPFYSRGFTVRGMRTSNSIDFRPLASIDFSASSKFFGDSGLNLGTSNVSVDDIYQSEVITRWPTDKTKVTSKIGTLYSAENSETVAHEMHNGATLTFESVVDASTERPSGISADGYRIVTEASTSPTVTYRVRLDGTVFTNGAYSSSGADFAEYFEWKDGNPQDENRDGLSVVIESGMIREAEQGETPVGAISDNPTVTGNSNPNTHSSFGTADYNPAMTEKVIYCKQTGVEKTVMVAAYSPRVDRPEWSPVGILGLVWINHGQVIADNWIRLESGDDKDRYLIK